jgi:hypothetical protein
MVHGLGYTRFFWRMLFFLKGQGVSRIFTFAPYLGGAHHTHTPTTNCYKLSEEDNTSTPLQYLHLKEADDLRGEKLLLTA